MSMIVFRYLHFLGMIFWIGSAVAVSIAAAAPTPKDSGIAETLRKITLRVTTPAMLVAFAGGFGMLIPNFVDFYVRQGWMHTKLTLLLLIAGATGVLTGRLRRLADGREITQKTFSRLSWVISILSILIVTVSIFRPFGG
jgi:putative membrane protein